MPFAHTPAGSICYETDGDRDDPAVLLVAGLNAQLTSWPETMRAQLAATGFRVVVFDNRDSGLSFAGDESSYNLQDMATDMAALMDELAIQEAHIVGQSMGGMIAQEFALQYPERTLSLCSIYSAPHARFINQDPGIWSVKDVAAPDRNAAVELYVEQERISGLEEYSEEWIQAYARRTIDRAYRPDGSRRQLRAVRERPDRTQAMTAIEVPTVVLHGLEDKLIDVQGGYATAFAIPGAELHTFARMGHQLLPSLFHDYVRIISRNCHRRLRRDRHNVAPLKQRTTPKVS